jgi:hypothetical protein
MLVLDMEMVGKPRLQEQIFFVWRRQGKEGGNQNKKGDGPPGPSPFPTVGFTVGA